MNKKNDTGSAPDPHENADVTPNPAEAIAELQDEIARLKVELGDQQTTNGALNHEIDTLRKEVECHDTEEQAWELDLQAARDEIKALKAENEALKGQRSGEAHSEPDVMQAIDLYQRLAVLQLWRDNNPDAADIIYTKTAGVITPDDVRMARRFVATFADHIPDAGKMVGEVGDG